MKRRNFLAATLGSAIISKSIAKVSPDRRVSGLGLASVHSEGDCIAWPDETTESSFFCRRRVRF